MTQLDIDFQALTGLRYTVSDMVEGASTPEEKQKVYDFITWNIKQGRILEVPANAALVTSIMNAIKNLDQKSTIDEVEEVETYTAAEAIAYNATLPGAVKVGDVQTPAVEAQEEVEAKNAVYSFESFNNEEKEVKYGEGIVEVIELREDGATVKVLENQSTDPNAADFTNLEFNVNSLDETATLQLFSTEGLAQPIWVTFEKVSDAVEGQEAIAAQDAVLYTEETAAAYNATLEGAVKEGDVKQ